MTNVTKEFHRINELVLEVLRVKAENFDLKNPSILMLHEGLGSVSMWKDLPMNLANLTGCEVIVYSRAGYGKSSPAVLPRNTQYMHVEALEVLPRLIRTLRLKRPLLLGHSDGASIALICAGGTDTQLSGLVLIAPHINVEQMAIKNISRVKSEWQTGDLRERLVKYHDDVESAFRGWSDTWLHREFIHWNIEEYLPNINIPLLAIQGYEDEYSSMAQIDGIKSVLPQTELVKLHNCGHSPHKDQPQKLLKSIKQFVSGLPCQKGKAKK